MCKSSHHKEKDSYRERNKESYKDNHKERERDRERNRDRERERERERERKHKGSTFDAYSLMPDDNLSQIELGQPILFPRNLSVTGTDILRVNEYSFKLVTKGIYIITWHVSITEPAQLILSINNMDYAQSLTGRSSGTSQITGSIIYNNIDENTIISLINPIENDSPITITSKAGGNLSASAHLIIIKLH